MSKPTIALIPSGYKTDTPYGTVYSILPNDGTQDFRLDRASKGTRVRKDGLIEETLADTPRLDYTNSDCPTILRENQRSNLQLRSEEFDNSVWSKVNTSITANQIVAPNGEYTADQLTATTSSLSTYIYEQHSLSTSTDYSMSVFVKKGTSNLVRLDLEDFTSGTQGRMTFNLNTKEITQTVGTASYEDYGNGWYRLKVSFTTSATLGVHYLRIWDYETVNGAYFYLWGAQLEAGIGSTSYIKTEGNIETRNLDNLECTTTYTVGSDCTWYFDFESYSYDSSFKQLFLIRNGDFTQYIDIISYESGGTYYMRARATSNGGTQNYIIAFGEDAILNFTRNRVAIRLYESNYEVYVNGTREYAGTASAGEWDALNGLDIVNDFGASTTAPSYRLYDFRVYDQTMTQSELEELTTL